MRIKKATIATTLTSNVPSGCLGVERPLRWVMGRGSRRLVENRVQEAAARCSWYFFWLILGMRYTFLQ